MSAINAINIECDATGFPIIQTPTGGWVHLVPVTKVQFETYLYMAQPENFGAKRYAEATAGNPRVGPGQVTPGNAHGLLMSGLKRTEAEAFAAWLNKKGSRPGRVPAAEEWYAVYQWLKATTFGSLLPQVKGAPGLDPRALAIATALDRVGRLRGLGLNALFVSGGVLEYVDGGLMGTPNGQLDPHPQAVNAPHVPFGNDGRGAYGLRLHF